MRGSTVLPLFLFKKSDILGCRRELTLSVTNATSLLESNEVLVSICIPYTQEVIIIFLVFFNDYIFHNYIVLCL